jgi:hypothetical protein
MIKGSHKLKSMASRDFFYTKKQGEKVYGYSNEDRFNERAV